MSQYCSESEFYLLGLRQEALEETVANQINLYLTSTSAFMDGFFRSRYGSSMPFTTFSVELKRNCAIITAYDIITWRGYNPANPNDEVWRNRYLDVINWLENVANGDISLGIVPGDGITTPSSGAPSVRSNRNAGFQNVKARV